MQVQFKELYDLYSFKSSTMIFCVLLWRKIKLCHDKHINHIFFLKTTQRQQEVFEIWLEWKHVLWMWTVNVGSKQVWMRRTTMSVCQELPVLQLAKPEGAASFSDTALVLYIHAHFPDAVGVVSIVCGNIIFFSNMLHHTNTVCTQCNCIIYSIIILKYVSNMVAVGQSIITKAHLNFFVQSRFLWNFIQEYMLRPLGDLGCGYT